MPDEITPFFPYDLTVDGKTFTVVESAQPDAYYVRTDDGTVLGFACADSTVPLDAVGLATLLSTPQTVTSVPSEVTRRQLWLALNAMSVTRSAVKTQLAGNEAALIELEEAQSYRRDNPLVAMLGTSLKMTAAQIDNVFIAASSL